MNTILKIQLRGTVTLPKKIRENLSLKEGDFLNIDIKKKNNNGAGGNNK